MESTAQQSKGQVYEGLAFTFCKVATVALIAQRFTLPVAALSAAAFYLLAWRHGKRDTKCFLGSPLVIIPFWGLVGAYSLWLLLGKG